jgi:g-D-glutamyl-meso-diaminopimelate peptidase
MQTFPKQKLAIILGSIGILGIGVFVVFSLWSKDKSPELAPVDSVEVTETEPVHNVLGASVEGRNIESYTYGNGDTHLLFVGGIHGGYEWNSVLLAYEFMDYVEENPDVVPDSISITVIPSANPDAVQKVTGKEGRFTAQDVSSGDKSFARFNANNVDLNRNFDCKWQPQSTWRGNPVSAGTKPFSEPEAVAIKNFVEANNPDAVIFWHSQAGAVYASECEDGIFFETLDIMNAYANAAGYRAVEFFDAYEITGDAEGWLASIGIPAITVELSTHESIEWQKNLAGIQAVFRYYNRQ